MIARIGVTGASGHLGGGVASLLATAAVPVRLIVRNAARAPDLPDVEVAVASYDPRDDEVARLTGAFSGVETLYLVSAEESHDRLERHRAAVRAAAAAGVGRIVYTSFLGASPGATFHLARDHFHTERFLTDTGIPFVALRNSLYADVLPHFVTDGVLAGPAGDGRFAPVARADVVEVSAVTLLDDSWDTTSSLDLTGPTLVTMDEVAGELTTLLDSPVRYEDQTRAAAYASRADLGAPAWLLDAWISTYVAIARGEMAVVSDTVERMTGHPATPLRDHRREPRLPPTASRGGALGQRRP
jgi:NAD(P)H dehydrogenase (quinone)